MEVAEIPAQKPNIGVILEKSDLSFTGTGMKPSEAWQYRETIKAKYNLPESGYRWQNPSRYIQEIEDLLRKEGVTIREKHEFQQFFKENPDAGALSSGPDEFRDNTVVVGSQNPDGEMWRLLSRSHQMAHEAVHALQKKKYPRMPVEEAEREAYLYQKFDQVQIEGKQEEPADVAFILEIIEKDIQNSVKTNDKINGRAEESNK